MIRAYIDIFKSGKLGLMFRFASLVNEFYRILYVVTIFKLGLDKLLTLERSLDEIKHFLMINEGDVVESWLELGVSLGLIIKENGKYRVSNLIKRLAEEENDDLRAILEEVATLHYELIFHTLSRLQEGKLWTLDDQEGQLIARSSRIVEPFIKAIIKKVFPKREKQKLLEVGCGSGIYIKHAIEHNPQIEAIGIELQPEVAQQARENIERWGIDHKVVILESDIREFKPAEKFDIITLYNNIYYFPVDERPKLINQLFDLLNNGGRLIIVTACQGGQPITQLLNLWGASTKGCGILPYKEEVVDMLRSAGFRKMRMKQLIPRDSFYAFWAIK